MKKFLAGTGIVLGVLVIGGFLFREQVVLAGIGYMSKRQLVVEPHREVTWSSGTSDIAKEDRPPNIILIVADDLGWNDLTFGGGGVAGGTVPTPSIDAIAAEGVQFTNGYAANATCAPSRAALMSGRYPTRFGYEFTPTFAGMMPIISMIGKTSEGPQFHRFDNPKGSDPLTMAEKGMPAEEVSLAETLKTAGYHTAHIGKWHLGQANGMSAFSQGFDESLNMASGLYLPENDPGVVNAKQDFDPIDRFLWAVLEYAASFNDSGAFEPEGYLTDYYTDEAVKVIEANKDRPFFLYLAHWAPHTPLQAAKEDYDALDHIELHRERVYAAMIRSLDRGVGEVMASLKANGLDENTLVIFTSDNGGAGYIGLPEVNQPYRGWKMDFFEGGIHVPYFMRWPDGIDAGTTVSDPVHHFDIYSTAASAARAAMPTDRVMDGVDLLPFLTAPVASEEKAAPHDALFWRSGPYQAALSDGWKLHRDELQGKSWLFNVAEDPTEQHEVSKDYPEEFAHMNALLDAHNDAQAEPSWPSYAASPHRIDKTSADPYAEDDEYIYWAN